MFLTEASYCYHDDGGSMFCEAMVPTLHSAITRKTPKWKDVICSSPHRNTCTLESRNERTLPICSVNFCHHHLLQEDEKQKLKSYSFLLVALNEVKGQKNMVLVGTPQEQQIFKLSLMDL
jgi:hypothetical protein